MDARWAQITVADLMGRLVALKAEDHPHGSYHDMIESALARLEEHFPDVGAKRIDAKVSQPGPHILRVSGQLRNLQAKERDNHG